MADRFPVDCGYRTDGNTVILTYTMKNVEGSAITWEWTEQGGMCIAKLEGRSNRGDIKYHYSSPIDRGTVSNFDQPKKSKDGDFYKVKLKWTARSSPLPDLQSYFIPC